MKKQTIKTMVQRIEFLEAVATELYMSLVVSEVETDEKHGYVQTFFSTTVYPVTELLKQAKRTKARFADVEALLAQAEKGTQHALEVVAKRVGGVPRMTPADKFVEARQEQKQQIIDYITEKVTAILDNGATTDETRKSIALSHRVGHLLYTNLHVGQAHNFSYKDGWNRLQDMYYKSQKTKTTRTELKTMMQEAREMLPQLIEKAVGRGFHEDKMLAVEKFPADGQEEVREAQLYIRTILQPVAPEEGPKEEKEPMNETMQNVTVVQNRHPHHFVKKQPTVVMSTTTYADVEARVLAGMAAGLLCKHGRPVEGAQCIDCTSDLARRDYLKSRNGYLPHVVNGWSNMKVYREYREEKAREMTEGKALESYVGQALTLTLTSGHDVTGTLEKVYPSPREDCQGLLIAKVRQQVGERTLDRKIPVEEVARFVVVSDLMEEPVFCDPTADPCPCACCDDAAVLQR